MSSFDAPQFVHKKVFEDPTPNGIINLRYVQHSLTLALATTLTDDEQEQFFRIVLFVGKKLVSVWKHKVAFQRIEEELLRECKPRDKSSPVFTIETSQELFLEFDEFLVQVKSALDYLVKIPVPILGRKTWSLRTFGGKGEDVLKVLRRNLGKSQKPQVDGIQKILFDKSRDWLQATIHARDKINHYIDGGISFEDFAVFCHPETGAVHRPMWSADQTVSAFLDVIWANLFRFAEDFTAMFLYFRHKPGLTMFHGEASMDSVKSPWRYVQESIFEEVTKQPGWRLVD